MVLDELKKRRYKYRQQTVDKIELYLNGAERQRYESGIVLFHNWHNYHYLTQCYYNLQEKYECGGMTADEWKPIDDYFMSIINKYCIGLDFPKI